MNLSEPMTTVVPRVTGSVLAVLARTDDPLTGRTIATMVKPTASQKGVANVLQHLVESGVVLRTDKGRSALFELNRDHVAAPAIAELASLHTLVLERFRSELTQWTTPPRSATIFGSFARGDGSNASDIDLLLVRPARINTDWAGHVAELTRQGSAWTGNPVNVIELSAADINALRDEPFLADAVRDGITVAGIPLRRVVAASIDADPPTKSGARA